MVKKFTHQEYRQYHFLLPFVKKYKWAFLVINIIVFYISFVNLTTISPSQMIAYSPLHPFGEKYALEQIQEVETGFYGSRLLFLYDKGDFYYQIKFKNGKTISIGDCYTLPLYEKHTYSELVEMDRLIMQYKPHKISSDKNFEYIQMDQEYIDRFLSIVNNQ